MTDFDWFPNALSFMDLYGIPREVVQAAADHPTTVTKNEDSGKDGWDIEDRRRGDVTAIVGLKPDVPEAIMYVRIFTGEDYSGQDRTAGGGHKEQPKTRRGVKARIVSDGFSIEARRDGTDLVRAKDGEVIFVLRPTMSTGECWGHYRRARDKYRIGERVGLGDLLESMEMLP